jgi:H+/Cl- antiporter ClcA/CBS domain-containing protein
MNKDMAKANQSVSGPFGDFTMSPRAIFISLLALCIGVIASFVALALLRLIGIFTNLFFFQRWGTNIVSPAGNHLGPFVIVVPVIGALIVGVMARYGSERIRGHGIPEAIEAILINGSKIQPRVAILKPISSAISIGSGGPFGAEGPIIMTGGAVGSILAQSLHLTSTERKTLLVAGAAAGMSATFAAPVAAVLLAVELLLFEWKPRSLIPVAIASATADVIRRYILGVGPIFPMPASPLIIGPEAILGCVVAGLLAGGMSVLLTMMVYGAEDVFHRLPIHWMWWPAIGGLGIGIGGFIFPQALGVGYNTIDTMLQGNVAISLILGILIVKSLIWSFSLGSGTSGGVLAPLLMIGGALGGIETLFLPHVSLGFWSLISMAAILGGAMRSPLTGTIFAVELTHNFNALLPLMVACAIAYGFSVLVMRRSILTEKVSRRGYHLSSEYATDPLETLFVADVMRTSMSTFSTAMPEQELVHTFKSANENHVQRLYPVLDSKQQLAGILSRTDMYRFVQDAEQSGREDTILKLEQYIKSNPVICTLNEPLRIVVYRMAETNLTCLPVVENNSQHRLVGIISLTDLLKARSRTLQEELYRERVLSLRTLFAREQTTKQVAQAVEESVTEGNRS